MRLAIFGSVVLLSLAVWVFVSTRGKVTDPGGPGAIRVPAGADLDHGNWQFGPSPCGAQECKIKFVIQPQKACHVGDLDIIEFDLEKFSHGEPALFTVEPIVSGKVVASPWFTRKVPLQELQSGTSFEMTFTPLTHPVQLGIFLCKDAAKENRCQGKLVMPVMKIARDDAEYANRHKLKLKVESPDRMYFFQYLLYDGERWMTFRDMSVKGLATRVFDQRRQLISDLAGAEEKETFNKAMERTVIMSRTLQSMPLELAPGEIRVVLPKQSPDCRK